MHFIFLNAPTQTYARTFIRKPVHTDICINIEIHNIGQTDRQTDRHTHTHTHTDTHTLRSRKTAITNQSNSI